MSFDLTCKPDDELPHAPEGDETLPWKDTWYFSIWDPASGTHVAMHMTVSANRSPDTRVAVGLRSGAHERVVVCREQGRRSRDAVGNRLAWIEPVHLSWGADHALRWRCQSEEFDFDLDIRGVHLAPDFHALFPGANPSGKLGHSYSHTEQVIRAEGRVRWKGEGETRISGFGWRDRGWGRRKNDVTFATGYDLVAAILPDGSAFAFTAMRNIEHGPDAPVAVYGFRADAQNVTPATEGVYFKDSQSFPSHLDLVFADGSRVTGDRVRLGSTLGTPFHDAEPELSGIAVAARDHYAVFATPGGQAFGVFSNEGHAHRANVTRDGKFFHRG